MAPRRRDDRGRVRPVAVVSEPTTAAGRRLNKHPWVPLSDVSREVFVDAILAIEAEARTDALREAQAAGDPALREAAMDLATAAMVVETAHEEGVYSDKQFGPMRTAITRLNALLAAPQPAAAPRETAEIDRLRLRSAYVVAFREAYFDRDPVSADWFTQHIADAYDSAVAPAAAPRETDAELVRRVRDWVQPAPTLPAAASAELADER